MTEPVRIDRSDVVAEPRRQAYIERAPDGRWNVVRRVIFNGKPAEYIDEVVRWKWLALWSCWAIEREQSMI